MTATVLAAGAVGYQHTRTDGRLHFQVMTAQIGAGVTDGSAVELAGVPVGQLERIDSSTPDHQLLTLALESGVAAQLTDTLALDYTPGNLFGISQITLRPGTGGVPLRDGAVIDLSGVGQVVDATMGRLLEQLATTAGRTLTPELTQVLNRLGEGLQAVGPLLRAVVEVTRVVTDTQRFPPAFLIGQYASGLQGAASLLDGSITLLDGLSHIPVLRTDRAMFDRAVDVISNDILPAASRTGFTAQHQLADFADLLGPLLRAVAATVPGPQRSGAQLRELLDRIDGAFADSPGGTVLNVEIMLRGMPAVAAPLLGAAVDRKAGR
ncbi:mammalian cell entry protein [Nocardia acidivorans]|uniref:mammalian cell entry protein n=1 Tax=Nocardia acidivorans TaxID=404580 RepID=UPI0012FCA6CB|nr:mammalian cell entry protein [Nocardia acidivorans]